MVSFANPFDAEVWASVPFHFWTAWVFVFGCITGSFLNVCIYRLPRDESIVWPPSHCPHCKYSIPWYLNIPLATWLFLKGKCANCGAPISPRYFIVELMTGLLFAACWIKYGALSAPLALVYCVFTGGLIIATFVDLEHTIIPDSITIGGVVAGFVFSFLVPSLHSSFPGMQRLTDSGGSLFRSAHGAVFGALLIYGIVRLGKLAFGRKTIELAPGSKVLFTESDLRIPGQQIAYGDVFYRESDTIRLEARRVELADRCYAQATVRLRPKLLRIGEDRFDPEKTPHLEAVADRIVLPREAMGMGDVKFIAAIGAFLGWPAICFILAVSSCLGSVVSLSMIALKKRERSSEIPFGPYIAAAAMIWVLCGRDWTILWLRWLQGA